MQTPLRFAAHRRIEPNMSDEEERDSFDDVEHFEGLAEQAMLSKLIAQLQQTNDETVKPEALAIKLRALTPPETSPKTQPETLFSCYYKPPPETLRLPPSPVSISSRSPSLC
jgi:hypothetical protein